MKQTLLSTHPVPPCKCCILPRQCLFIFSFLCHASLLKSPLSGWRCFMFTGVNNSFVHLRIQWSGRKRRHKLHVIHKDEVRRMPSEDKTNYCGTFWGTLWTQVISYHFMLNLPEIYFMICFVAILELRHSSECEKLVKNQWKIGTGVIWVWF